MENKKKVTKKKNNIKEKVTEKKKLLKPEEMLVNKNTILALADGVEINIEADIKEGSVVLYNKNDKSVWIGNIETLQLINKINGKFTLGEIYKKILSEYEEDSFLPLMSAMNKIIAELLKKSFLIII